MCCAPLVSACTRASQVKKGQGAAHTIGVRSASPGGTRRRHGAGSCDSGSMSEDYEGGWDAAAVAGHPGGLAYQPAAADLAAADRSFPALRLAAEWLWHPALVWLVVAIYFLLLLLPPPTARGILTPLPW